mgnify:CR=1
MNNFKKNIFKTRTDDIDVTSHAIPISSQAGSSSLSEACGYTDRLLTAYAELPSVFAGSTLYRDTALTLPFGEYSPTRFHAITAGSVNKSIELDLSGVILSISTCSP